MIFHKTPLDGARLIELEKRGDDRGFFARFFCEKEFAAEGLETRFVQINNSLSSKKGTLRGLHYQLPPSGEVKIVRAIRGALFDVIVDLRAGSPSFGKWFGAELSAENRMMMYVPRGFGHAFITLTDDTEALYLVSDFYAPDCERGVRYNDPAIGIEWPIEPIEISEKDKSWPDLNAEFHGMELMRGLK
ncbi:dTDP-4-dehydrorhamnose 3,5-epimerase [Rhizobium sp. RM]|uniref:dTDP-4-dehydrorhamnose 3,5-epimerase n=1 Tax=Rhizobium sp. RM TaxID=2748079 RepID=UPI00110F16D0|nr:dTDP-4-dehydrorhamnose 3,5-epimerase [Rhizobium sp. RM]NWJ27279.1 dTDP-4-dehydrorhamnose 3,5-epimerase [Rhizobium sp. RM]TMV20339.1 dTDP-4-dehydrorhamnose 3,5-epimerase [Rhizobium sp. Td3]